MEILLQEKHVSVNRHLFSQTVKNIAFSLQQAFEYSIFRQSLSPKIKSFPAPLLPYTLTRTLNSDCVYFCID